MVVVDADSDQEEEEGKGAAAQQSASGKSSKAKAPLGPRFLPTVSRGSATRGSSSSSSRRRPGAAQKPLPQHVQRSKREGQFERVLAAGITAEEDGEGGEAEEEKEVRRAHTVDLYVPPADLEVMLAWADRLAQRRRQRGAQGSLPSPSSSSAAAVAAEADDEPQQGRGKGPQQEQEQQGRRAGSKALVALSKEQRLLSLAQMFLGMEKLRTGLSEAEPGPGAVTPRELAGRLGLRPSEVEAFYKLGLRARSYILMSMHGLILALAARYAAAFGDAVDRAELVQEGYKGAMLAVERYDPTKGQQGKGGASLSLALSPCLSFPV